MVNKKRKKNKENENMENEVEDTQLLKAANEYKKIKKKSENR